MAKQNKGCRTKPLVGPRAELAGSIKALSAANTGQYLQGQQRRDCRPVQPDSRGVLSGSPKPAPAPQAADAAPVAGGGKPDAPRVPSWRAGLDFIGMLAVALAAAFIIKAYAFDIYLIPSGSMETALHGRPDGGDRIFCSKFDYRFRGPRRWEVAVFTFPYDSARQNDISTAMEQYQGENFVKRIVGLPGETLAIYRGDIWVRDGQDAGGAEYRRLVKPASVQQGMWQAVYREDFRDRSLQELERFWKILGGGAELPRGGELVLNARQESVRMDYRPLAPAGAKRDRMVELPGIPDRYVLEQPAQFRCRGTAEDGSACGHLFSAMIATHAVQARCPRCGTLADETAVAFYQRRSGLPAVGRYAVHPESAPQGEATSPRVADYHIVPDVRVAGEVTLEREETEIAFLLREDARFIEAAAAGDGRVSVRINGAAARPEHTVVAGIRPGGRHRLECSVVDGTVRVYVDGAAEAVLEAAVWEDDRRGLARNLPRTSGVALVASGGNVTVGGLTIDRDVFYYSGWERERGERFPSIRNGEVRIDEDSFLPMGDHCPSSYDARSWGPVALSLLQGPVHAVWWPPERFHFIAKP